MSNNEEPLIIVVKTDIETYEMCPDVTVTIKTDDPCDCVELAARVLDLFRKKFECDPIVKFTPFLKEC